MCEACHEKIADIITSQMMLAWYRISVSAALDEAWGF